MTFGSTFGRTFSPTFQPSSQAAAVASSWWLAGGIAAADCLLAYQPKGAASLAASYVNLANPGTYDAAPGATAPTLTSDGWYLQKTVTTAVDTTLACGGHWSVILKLKRENVNATAYYLMAFQYLSGSRYHGFGYTNSNTNALCHDGGDTLKYLGSGLSDNVFCLTADDTYVDSVSKGEATEGTLPSTNYYFGNRISAAVAGQDQWIAAAAIYSITLTSTQVGLLTTAMNAL